MKYLTLSLLPILCFSCITKSISDEYWNSAGGPNNDYQLLTNSKSPDYFSLEKNKNISWTMDLPEGGQSGLAIVGNKIFLSVLEPSTKDKINKNSTNILALCIDAQSRKILWKHHMKGIFGGPSLYGFSDSSTPTPIADKQHVWFYNASGSIACLNHAGELVWEYNWKPIDKLDKVKFPFNKQYEPLISDKFIYNVEPYYKKDGKRKYGWNYLFAYEKLSGKLAWISEDGLTPVSYTHLTLPTIA